MIVKRRRAWRPPIPGLARIPGRLMPCLAYACQLSRFAFPMLLIVSAGAGLGAVAGTAKAVALPAARPLGDVVPAPASVHPDDVSYTIGPHTRIHTPSHGAEDVVEYLAELL